MDGTTVAQRREALGLTRQQLADALGVDAATVWRWENGRFDPSRLAARALAETLARLEREAVVTSERAG